MPFEDWCHRNPHPVGAIKEFSWVSCMRVSLSPSICAHVHSLTVCPISYLSNALSLGILFYYLLSPQPFTSNPSALAHVGTSPSVSWSICLSISLPICLYASVCLSVLSFAGLFCLCNPLCLAFLYLPLSPCPTCPSIISVSHNRTATAAKICQKGELAANFLS